MRTLLAILAAALLILLGSFFFLGSRARDVVQETLASHASGASGSTMTLKERKSGLFSSRLVYRQELTLTEGSGKQESSQRLVFDVAYDIAHGPVPFAAGNFSPCLALVAINFSVDPASDAAARDFFERLPELASSRATIRYAFDLRSVMELSVPPLERTFPDDKGGQVNVRFQGLTGSAVMNPAMDAVSGTMSSPGLSIKDKDSGSEMDGLSITFDAQMSKPDFWTGKYAIRAKSFRVAQAGGQSIHFRDTDLELSLLPRGNALDYLFALAGAVVPEQGQAVPMRMSMAARNLDAAAMERMVGLLRAGQASGRAPGEAAMRAAGEALLAGKPELDFDLMVLAGDALQALHAEARIEGFSRMPQNLAGLLPTLRAKAEFSGREPDLLGLLCDLKAAGHKTPPEQCRQMLGMTVETLIAQDRLRKEGDRLLSSAQWDGAQFTLNGAPAR